MGWHIDFDDCAKSDLVKLDLFDARGVLQYLNRIIAPNEDPRRVGHPYGDQWLYETNGVLISVKISDNIEHTESAPDEGKDVETPKNDEDTKATPDKPTILVLAICRKDQNTLQRNSNLPESQTPL